MKTLSDLDALTARHLTAPFSFDQFEHRRALVRHRSRNAGWGAAAALGLLAVVPVIAVITQPQPAAHVLARPASQMQPLADVFQQPPALVDMGRFALTSEMEDYIALLDAEISAARLMPVPREDLQRMEAARAQLNDSLQRVTHAHAMLDL